MKKKDTVATQQPKPKEKLVFKANTIAEAVLYKSVMHCMATGNWGKAIFDLTRLRGIKEGTLDENGNEIKV